MTMINAVVQEGTGYLYADSAIIHPTNGKLLALAPKICVGECFPWAVGITFNGAPAALAELAALDWATNVDDLLALVAPAIEAWHLKAPAPGIPCPLIRLVLVAWDQALSTARLFLAGDSVVDTYGQSPHCPAGIAEVEYHFGCGNMDPRHLWNNGHPNDPRQFDVQRHGLAVFEERRRLMDEPRNGLAPGTYVGGSVFLVEVHGAGTATFVLHSWPDQIGELICPDST